MLELILMTWLLLAFIYVTFLIVEPLLKLFCANTSVLFEKRQFVRLRNEPVTIQPVSFEI